MATARDRRSVGAPALLERGGELDRLRSLLDAAADDRRGGVALVRGPAGIGKTRLLEEAGQLAAARGFARLAARGGEFESDFAFGVVRGLFEPVLRDAAAEDRAQLLAGAAEFARPALELQAAAAPTALAADPAAAILHGLYWLTVNLAERGPVLVLVDDAQWADALSLRYLAYVARRIDELPVVLLVSERSGEPEPSESQATIDILAADPATAVIEPAPLGLEAVQAFVAAAMDGPPEPEFAAACRESTGGNPFLLGELLAALAEDGVAPTAHSAATVPRARPWTIARVVMARLGRLGEAPERLAAAVAVLGDGAPLRHAAALAGLDVDAAAEAAEALAGASILAPSPALQFAHPIVRAALLDELTPARRARLHGEAARALRADGAPADVVAAHLLATPPRGDADAVEVLREAAAAALGRGAAESAAGLLRRALAEPPPVAERAGVLFELGRVEARTFAPDAVAHLEEAWQLVERPRERVDVAIELGRALMFGGRTGEALEAFEHGRAEVADDHPDLAFHLDLEFIGTARFDPATRDLAIGRLQRMRREPPPSGPDRLRLNASLALEAIGTDTADEAVGLATAALAGGGLMAADGVDSLTLWFAIWPLILCDRYALAAEQLALVFEEAARAGSGRAFSVACCAEAMAAYRMGALEQAQASAERAADVPGGIVTQPWAIDAAVRAQLARGRVDEAQATLAGAGLADDIPDAPMFWPVLSARGLLRIASGEIAAGVEDCLGAGERAKAWRARSPTLLPWRTDAAVGLLALDQRARARLLAEEAVELCRAFGAPRCLGEALRMAGVATGGKAGISLLREAVAVLAPSRARLEHAYALLELGAALRRAGHRNDAREPLREAMELTYRCGATPAVERARVELLACGARPRRVVLKGVDALTPSERRIATMASDGLGNREIAQALFVTPKTVETHLSSAYRKLGVGSRQELPGVLTGSPAGA